MNRTRWIVLIVCVLLGMLIVTWLGNDYRDEVRAFLRTLRRIL